MIGAALPDIIFRLFKGVALELQMVLLQGNDIRLPVGKKLIADKVFPDKRIYELCLQVTFNSLCPV